MQYARQREIVSETRANDALWVTYRWMAAGLGITGLVALLVAHSPAAIALFLGTPLFYVLIFAQLGLVITLSTVAQRISSVAAGALFFGYAALSGVTFASIFLVYAAASIAQVFFITSGAFVGLSVYGFFTKSDLSAIGRFAIFALIGVIIASVVNIFLRSTGLDWLLSIVGVVLFAGLTAYDTQRLKAMFAAGVSGNLAIVGALTLYLDFINMFLFLLRLFGRRR